MNYKDQYVFSLIIKGKLYSRPAAMSPKNALHYDITFSFIDYYQVI